MLPDAILLKRACKRRVLELVKEDGDVGVVQNDAVKQGRAQRQPTTTHVEIYLGRPGECKDLAYVLYAGGGAEAVVEEKPQAYDLVRDALAIPRGLMRDRELEHIEKGVTLPQPRDRLGC